MLLFDLPLDLLPAEPTALTFALGVVLLLPRSGMGVGLWIDSMLCSGLIDAELGGVGGRPVEGSTFAEDVTALRGLRNMVASYLPTGIE